jgi:hypothetical protein
MDKLENALIAVARIVNENDQEILSALRGSGLTDIAEELREALSEWRAASGEALGSLVRKFKKGDQVVLPDSGNVAEVTEYDTRGKTLVVVKSFQGVATYDESELERLEE